MRIRVTPAMLWACGCGWPGRSGNDNPGSAVQLQQRRLLSTFQHRVRTGEQRLLLVDRRRGRYGKGGNRKEEDFIEAIRYFTRILSKYRVRNSITAPF